MAINIHNGFTVSGTFVKFAGPPSAAGLQGEAAKATLDPANRHLSVATDVKLSRIVNS